jgi:hypothetical protein
MCLFLIDIIKPLGYKEKERNESCLEQYACKINRVIQKLQFLQTEPRPGFGLVQSTTAKKQQKAGRFARLKQSLAPQVSEQVQCFLT